MSAPVRVARKRLDIGVADLARGLLYCLTPPARAVAEQRLAAAWTPAGSALSCLSARSGLDLLLTAVDWPPGSEVLLSALTIPQMAMLIRAHGFRPVPVDVDPETLRLDADAVERACTPATRALVHAQLLGATDDVGHLAAVARARGLLLVEDRAQAYDGRDRDLGPHADVALHSFGTIKTRTCLGGGVLLVRDLGLRARMAAQQQARPVQGTRSYAVKLVRGLAMLALAHPVVYPHFVRLASTLTGDYDAVVRRISRGYDDADLLEQLRQRPCPALLALLAHRLTHDDPARVQQRARAGELLAGALDPQVRQLGSGSGRRTHWLFPVVATDPDALVVVGRAAGFDLTRGSSTLVALAPGCRETHAAVADVVYLPAYAGMSDSDLHRLAAVVNAAERHARVTHRGAGAAQPGRSSTAEDREPPVKLPAQP